MLRAGLVADGFRAMGAGHHEHNLRGNDSTQLRFLRVLNVQHFSVDRCALDSGALPRGLRVQGASTCRHVLGLPAQQLDHLDAHIERQQQARRELANMTDRPAFATLPSVRIPTGSTQSPLRGRRSTPERSYIADPFPIGMIRRPDLSRRRLGLYRTFTANRIGP